MAASGSGALTAVSEPSSRPTTVNPRSMSQVASDQRRWRQSRAISTIASSCSKLWTQMPLKQARTYSDKRSASVMNHFLLDVGQRGGIGTWRTGRRSAGLLELLIDGLALVALSGQLLIRMLTEGLLYELTGFATFAAGEAARLDPGLTPGVDGDLDELHEPPPTRIVSLIDPSASDCSVIWWPFLRASILAFSTA